MANKKYKGRLGHYLNVHLLSCAITRKNSDGKFLTEVD